MKPGLHGLHCGLVACMKKKPLLSSASHELSQLLGARAVPGNRHQSDISDLTAYPLTPSSSIALSAEPSFAGTLARPFGDLKRWMGSLRFAGPVISALQPSSALAYSGRERCRIPSFTTSYVTPDRT
jgi:hypothetical protein